MKYWSSGSGLPKLVRKTPILPRVLGLASGLAGPISDALFAWDTANTYGKFVLRTLSPPRSQGHVRYRVVTRQGHTEIFKLDSSIDEPADKVVMGSGAVPGPGGPGDPFASAPIDTPSVGGVYLAAAAQMVGELGEIEAVTFDPVGQRVVLIGRDSRATALPPIRLEHLATAFASVFGGQTLDPGVTIDPDPDDPYADDMIVRFFGGVEETRFGYVLFEADRIMKALSLGRDNITGEAREVPIEGYHDLLELGFSEFDGGSGSGLWSRFWLVPEQVLVQVSPDRRTIAFPETRVRVKTETMRWRDGKLVPAGDEVDQHAEYFAAHMTRHYDAYARSFPVFAELKSLTNLVALAKWLAEPGIQADFDWLEAFAAPFDTPETTPSLTVSEARRSRSGDRVQVRKISVFGGVDLAVTSRYVHDDGALAETGRQAVAALGGRPGVDGGSFAGADGEPRRVAALPTSRTRAPGARLIREGELGLVERVYSSFHNAPGAFGRSWAFDLPRLHLREPERGTRHMIRAADAEVIRRIYRLSSPFGLREARFRAHSYDAERGRIVVPPSAWTGYAASTRTRPWRSCAWSISTAAPRSSAWTAGSSGANWAPMRSYATATTMTDGWFSSGWRSTARKASPST